MRRSARILVLVTGLIVMTHMAMPRYMTEIEASTVIGGDCCSLARANTACPDVAGCTLVFTKCNNNNPTKDCVDLFIACENPVCEATMEQSCPASTCP